MHCQTHNTMIVLILALLATTPQADSGVVQVTVAEPMGPVEGVLIRSAGRSAQTDAAGRTRITLPAGRQVLSLARIGYQPQQVPVLVVRDSVVSVTVEFVMDMAAELEEIKVSTTRIERLAGDAPIRVEVLDEMEVDENTLMAPIGITMLLNETPGLRVQSASATLGTGSVLKRKKMVGIARVVMARRERIMMLEAFGKGIMGTTLLYPYEIRSEEGVFEEIPELKLPDQMVGLAEDIIDKMTGEFEPDKFEDRYENAMIELIRSKQAGLPAPKEKPAARPANVVNLMDALRRSIENTGGKEKSAKAGKRAAAETPAPAKKRKKAG